MNGEMRNKIYNYLLLQTETPSETINELLSQVDEERGVTLEDVLLDKGIVTPAGMRKIKAILTEVECYDVANTEFDPKLLGLLTKEQAVKYCCLPLKIDDFSDNVLHVVIADPNIDFSLETLDDLKLITGYDIQPYCGLKKDILDKIEELYQ